MHPYLIKLGVPPLIQDYFQPYYQFDASGNLLFEYQGDFEVYGLAWHKVPSSEGLWMANQENLVQARKILICSAAMEAIAWLTCHYTSIRNPDQLCFVATGASLSAAKLSRLRRIAAGRQCALLYSNDLLGKLCDLRIAAACRSQPLTMTLRDDKLEIEFRATRYVLDADNFSISKFEKITAFRFGVHTLKPKGALTWLDQLTAEAFNT